MISLLLLLFLPLLFLLGIVWIVRKLTGRMVRDFVEIVLETGRWSLWSAITLMALGGTLVSGGIVLLVGVWLGYLSLFAALCICLAICTSVTIAAYLLARRSKKKILEKIGG